jgi:hypothetical protein
MINHAWLTDIVKIIESENTMKTLSGVFWKKWFAGDKYIYFFGRKNVLIVYNGIIAHYNFSTWIDKIIEKIKNVIDK